MGRYVYCGSQGDEIFSGYTYLECYQNAETGEKIRINSWQEDMALKIENGNGESLL